MRLPLPSRLRAARGFSLPELMIAAAIGLALLAGLSAMFVKNTRAQSEIERANRQVENGRFALDLLAVDLRNAGYYGEFDPSSLPDPAALPAPCAATLADLNAGLALAVQGVDDDATGLDCLKDVRDKTDVLVVRRASTCIAGDPGCAPLTAGGPFFQASLCNNPSELDAMDSANFYALGLTTAGLDRHQRNCTGLAAIRRYRTHIYFIANNNQDGDHIPTLKRAELGSDGSKPTYTIVALAEGIENLQLEYGLDLLPATAGNGVADQFNANPATAGGCAAPACAVSNWRGVVSVKLNLLASNASKTPGWTDDKSYRLGRAANGAVIEIAAPGDQYKRHVFQALVALPNPAGRRIPQ